MLTKDGKVKLTEAGAEALNAWVRRTGAGLSDLAGAMGTNQMLPSRALRRQGWLTLEQAGRLVAFIGGEITAEQLFGSDRAGAVPTYPLRVRAPRVPVRLVLDAPTPATGATPPEDDDGPPSIDELRRLGRKGLRRLEQLVDEDQSAATAAAKSAHRLVKSWVVAEAAEQERAKAGAVKEVDLIQKFEALLYHARRTVEEDERKAALVAVAPVEGTP